MFIRWTVRIRDVIINAFLMPPLSIAYFIKFYYTGSALLYVLYNKERKTRNFLE